MENWKYFYKWGIVPTRLAAEPVVRFWLHLGLNSDICHYVYEIGDSFYVFLCPN